MKGVFCLVGAILCLGGSLIRAQVTIGSPNPPDPSAILEVQGNSGGFLLPRLTLAERNQIPAPAEGLQIYNTDTKCVEVYFPSSGWKAIGCDCTTPPPTPLSVSGAVHVCEAAQGELFVVQAVPGALNYVWTIPNQDVLVSGQGNDSIVINFSNTPGIRTISVVASNSCGVSASYSFTVDVSNPDPTFTFSPNPIVLNNAATFQANEPGATYAWIFTSGSPGTSTSQNPSVTWTNAGTYQVDLTVTDADGCIAQSSSQVTVTACLPTLYSFTNCGATGQFGPDQTQANATYGPGVVTVTGGIQNWTVPATGTYRIEAAGADGSHNGSGYGGGGRGAILAGDIFLNQGDVLKILVGQSGKHGTSAGGGGGGSFVTTSANVPLVIAGGGGSSRSGATINYTITDGTTSNCGVTGTGGAGGCNGNGAPYASEQGPGAAGLLTDGPAFYDTRTMCFKEIALSFLNGGRGGRLLYDCGQNPINLVYGGFGGGAAAGWGGAAGGGGYSGGGCGSNSTNSGFGGGGGSFIAVSATQVATSNGLYNNSSSHNGPIQNLGMLNAGNGYVKITRVCP